MSKVHEITVASLTRQVKQYPISFPLPVSPGSDETAIVRCKIPAVRKVGGEEVHMSTDEAIKELWQAAILSGDKAGQSLIVQFSLPKGLVGSINTPTMGEVTLRPRMSAQEACALLCYLFGLDPGEKFGLAVREKHLEKLSTI